MFLTLRSFLDPWRSVRKSLALEVKWAETTSHVHYRVRGVTRRVSVWGLGGCPRLFPNSNSSWSSRLTHFSCPLYLTGSEHAPRTKSLRLLLCSFSFYHYSSAYLKYYFSLFSDIADENIMDLQLYRAWTVAFDSSVIELNPPRTWTELSLGVILASAQSDVLGDLDQVLLNTSVY